MERGSGRRERSGTPALAVSTFTVDIPRRGPILSIPRLTVSRGETLLISGESGSGKSTFLRIVAGLVRGGTDDATEGGHRHERDESEEVRWSGEIAVDGTPLSARTIREYRRSVFWLAQTPRLESGVVDASFEAIAAYADNRAAARSPEWNARIDEILTALGLDPAIRNSDVRSVSGGEAARIAIARMILLNRPLLLLDEPTAALDTARTTQILGVIRRFVGPDTTIVVAGHDEALRNDTDRVVTIRGGGVTVDTDIGGEE